MPKDKRYVSSSLLVPKHSPPADTAFVSTSCNEKIRKDMMMSERAKPTLQELKKSVLHRLDAARKEIEELSEDELESVAGGWAMANNTRAQKWRDMIGYATAGDALHPD
jgi:hypothetical protein